MRTFTSTRIARFVLIPALSLWIAGAGCLMGCEGMVAAAASVPSSIPAAHSGHSAGRNATSVAAGQSCSSTGSHSCCAKKSADPKSAKRTSKSDMTLVTFGSSSSGMVKDCPLRVGKAVIAAKVRTNEVAAAPVLAHSNLPAAYVPESTSPLSSPIRLPNRGHTYLRCCVFLI